jgi:hypothetical protein
MGKDYDGFRIFLLPLPNVKYCLFQTFASVLHSTRLSLTWDRIQNGVFEIDLSVGWSNALLILDLRKRSLSLSWNGRLPLGNFLHCGMYRGGDLKPSKCSGSRSSGPSTSFQKTPRKSIVSVTILNPFGMLCLSLDNVKSFVRQNRYSTSIRIRCGTLASFGRPIISN